MNEQGFVSQGLTTQQAQRLHEEGKGNVPPRAAGRTLGQIVFHNLFTWFNILNFLLALALIGVHSWRNMLFMGVVISNTLISTIQEIRAKKTVDRLTLLVTAPVHVLRDGQWTQLPAEQLVLGDVVIFSAGDQVCADADVVYGLGAADESLLTGESDPVPKQQGEALYSGSVITEGKLYASLKNVGEQSYAGQLVQSVRTIKVPRSQLMEDLKKLIRVISYFLIPLGLMVFFKQYRLLDYPLNQAVPSAVAAMIGMIPEGLMLLTSMALAVGVVRLGKQNTLVQELYGIENLARVDTLCVDKTGTITKGMLEVEHVIPLGEADQQSVDKWMMQLLQASEDDNLTFQALRSHWTGPVQPAQPVAGRVPFSSARKWSAIGFAMQGCVVLGAPEFVLGSAMPDDLRQQVSHYATQGLRVMLLCRSANPLDGQTLPDALQPLALITLNDQIRDDFAETAAYLAREGVDIKVISGDNPLTVAEVARRAGLQGADRWVDMSLVKGDEALERAAEQFTVFGRVAPEQKQRLVVAMKAAGKTVGMMGDGVNDVPALKVCDCAIAMAGGNDAARRVSQLTLLKENFSALPQVILEGRRVINNISRSASLFLVKTLLSFLLSLMTLLLPIRYPFEPIQMTLISSFTIGIPSFFLALAPNRERVQGHFTKTIVRNALPGAVTNVLLLLVLYAVSGMVDMSPEQRGTIAVAVVGFTGLLVLAYTSRPLNLMRGLLLAAMAGGMLLTALLMPKLFYLVPLAPTGWVLLVILLVLSPVCLAFLRSAVQRFFEARHKRKSA